MDISFPISLLGMETLIRMETQHHIMPFRTYLNVFGLLMALTLLTVGIAYVDLGPLNIFVAVGIASAKAYVVILYFMHVKYSNKIIWLTAAAGFLFFILLLGLTLSDYATRSWIPVPGEW